MYIKQAQISRVKCFEDLQLTFQSSAESGDVRSNWNVIIGQNGDGKTTLVRALAACLVDAVTANRMLDVSQWIRKTNNKNLSPETEDTARISALWKRQEDDLTAEPERQDYLVEYLIAGKRSRLGIRQPELFSSTTILEPNQSHREEFSNFEIKAESIRALKQNAWNSEHNGWLRCGYGPYRRVFGNDPQSLIAMDGLHLPFRTLTHEGAALQKGESWLKDLELAMRRKEDENSPERMAYERTVAAVRELLPEVRGIEISEEIRYDMRGTSVNLGQLSDGYRGMFVLIADLMFWMQATAKPGADFREMSGVVLIDEIDAHLHPRWQRMIGFELTRIFPRLQFIVTTHSPFVAMAAGPGCLTVLETIESVTGQAIGARAEVADPRGWAVNRVLSDVFGLASLRDPQTEKMLQEYDRLAEKGNRDVNDDRRLSELTAELNRRLEHESIAPDNRELARDLEYFARNPDGPATNDHAQDS